MKIIYFVTVLTSIILMYSVLTYGNESNISDEFIEIEEETTDYVIETETEETTSDVTETTTEEITSDVTETTTEEITLDVTEIITEETTEVITEESTLSAVNEGVAYDVTELEARVILEGDIGSGAHYKLEDTDGDNNYDRLIISGSGSMPEYGYWGILGNSPWYNYSSTITSIVVEEGITYIGSRNFANLTNLKSIEIPNSVTSVYSHWFGENASFYNCTIENLYCYKDSFAATNTEDFGNPAKIKYISDDISINYKGEYSFDVVINSTGFGGSDLSSLYVNDFAVIVNDDVVDLGNVEYYDDGETMTIPVAVTSNSDNYSQYTFRAQIDSMAHKTPNSAVTQYVSSGFEF